MTDTAAGEVQGYVCTFCKSTYKTAGLCIECGVPVVLPAAAALLAEAAHIDPGLSAASLAPIGSRERDRHERIRDHYIAYGIRHALDNLGLMPDD